MVSLQELLKRLLAPTKNQVERPLWEATPQKLGTIVEEANEESSEDRYALTTQVPKIIALDDESKSEAFAMAAAALKAKKDTIVGLRRDQLRGGEHVIESEIVAYFLLLEDCPQLLSVLSDASYHNLMVMMHLEPAIRTAVSSQCRQ